jgi:hypothetical protein
MIFVIATAFFYRSRTYWYVVLAILLACLLVHLLYRFKTKAWSQPWEVGVMLRRHIQIVRALWNVPRMNTGGTDNELPPRQWMRHI